MSARKHANRDDGGSRNPPTSRTVAIKGPFQVHSSQQTHWARGAVVTSAKSYDVVVSVSGLSSLRVTDGGGGQILDDGMQEGMMLFGLIDLALRSIEEFKRSDLRHISEIMVAIPAGPGRRGEWTIDEIREHAREQLRSYNVSRWGTTWEARPKGG